eukprot:SAG31_NODE_337_length_17493_cov_5.855755_15_plen_209_part_00
MQAGPTAAERQAVAAEKRAAAKAQLAAQRAARAAKAGTSNASVDIFGLNDRTDGCNGTDTYTAEVDATVGEMTAPDFSGMEDLSIGRPVAAGFEASSVTAADMTVQDPFSKPTTTMPVYDASSLERGGTGIYSSGMQVPSNIDDPNEYEGLSPEAVAAMKALDAESSQGAVEPTSVGKRIGRFGMGKLGKMKEQVRESCIRAVHFGPI